MQTKQDHAYQYLRNKILARQFLPGERIIASQVANELGISDIPIREALFRLQSEKLVSIQPHIGAIVTLATQERIVETLEALALLEGYATRLSLPHAHVAITDLDAIHLRMRAAAQAQRWGDFSELNRDFHFCIYELCSNETVVEAVHDLWSRLDTHMSPAAFYLIPERALGSVEEHGRIVDMLRDPKADSLELELLARAHKLKTAEYIAIRNDAPPYTTK